MNVRISLTEAKWLVRLLEDTHMSDLRLQLEQLIAAQELPDEYKDDCARLGVFL